ncbi:PilX N-terminal domain-containing pilus assembly protein [Rivibacter subsaxonicus]|uniref:PilX-like prepilin protein n=1 Tax=Rivibacter subsaxonicus TaxID=457575 RepID=A0A4Q7VNQ1_9BURK|nr:PilX N-terminal domain-containing pilus assembly protein [Rivibacter subsaxonicus]RZT97952.1 PilX-like prepilin protein [Rivibacter subsaxonicus]
MDTFCCTRASRPHRQRGIAALGVALVLLFTMSVILLFANRNLIFEQRSAANHQRATAALAAADAGLEWGLARLNDPRRADTSCQPAATPGLVSARERWLGNAVGSFDAIATGARPGCHMAHGGELHCVCPAVGGSAPAGSNGARFTLRLAPVAGDPLAVELRSAGCINEAGDCSGAGDAVATTRLLARLLPRPRQLPAAAVTAGGELAAGAGVTLVNIDADAMGLAVHTAGSAPELPGQIRTLPGTSETSARATGDPMLLGLAAADTSGQRLLRAYLGAEAASLRELPSSAWLCNAGQSACAPRATACADADACGTAARDAADAGFSLIWIDGALTLDGPLGDATHPVLLVTSGALNLRAGASLTGMAVGSTPIWTLSGETGSRVLGAALAARDLALQGTLEIGFDAEVLRRLQREAGQLVRVAGSWRDEL